jgi:hypothetical protein
MIQALAHHVAGGRPSVWRTDGWATLASCLVTVALEVTVFLVTWKLTGFADSALIVTLAVMLVWAALATPALASAGQRFWGGGFRGGVVGDSIGLFVLTLSVFIPELTFVAALKIYVIIAMVVLAGLAVTGIGRTPAGRSSLAVACAAFTMIVLASPVWLSGLAGSLAGPARDTAAIWAVRINPFFAIADALRPGIDFVWVRQGLMYRLSPFGEEIPVPAASWLWAVGCFGGVGVLAGAIAFIRRRGESAASPAATETASSPGRDG